MFQSGVMLLEIKFKINKVDRCHGMLLRLWVLELISRKFRLLDMANCFLMMSPMLDCNCQILINSNDIIFQNCGKLSA